MAIMIGVWMLVVLYALNLIYQELHGIRGALDRSNPSHADVEAAVWNRVHSD